MKIKLLLVSLSILLAGTTMAQSIFLPKPLPASMPSFKEGAAAPTTVTKNFIRPIISGTASLSNGTQLAGGFGFSFQHDYIDSASKTWAIRYEISVLGFLGVGAGKISGTAGLVFGIPDRKSV